MERVFQGIKMETKQQFLEEINKVKGSKRDYLNKLFQYVSEAVIRAAVHKNVKKDEFSETELCLKLSKAGYQNLLAPAALAFQSAEEKSKPDQAEKDRKCAEINISCIFSVRRNHHRGHYCQQDRYGQNRLSF